MAADHSRYPMDVQALLHEAEKAREGRDRWRRVGPILAKLHAAGVSFREIREATGISVSTAHRHVQGGVTTASTPSPATP